MDDDVCSRSWIQLEPRIFASMAFNHSHSRLVQRQIGDPLEADRAFADTSNNELPTVLVPRQACCYYSCLNVPSGPYVLWQRWNKHQGAVCSVWLPLFFCLCVISPFRKFQLAPGLKMCWPAWNKISHIVSMGTITYDAPASVCCMLMFQQQRLSDP